MLDLGQGVVEDLESSPGLAGEGVRMLQVSTSVRANGLLVL